MLILGIESATVQVGSAIGGHEGVISSAHLARGKRHAESLMPQVEFICAQAGIAMSEVSVVAVDTGPGLFTGLRVGVASAKAIAQALKVPMIGVSSLDLLAFPMRYSNRTIVTALDARRGELFSARYRAVPGGVQRLSGPDLGTPEELASNLLAAKEDCLLVGDGAHRYADQFGGLNRVELVERGLAHPTATALVQLAHARALREDWVPPSEIHPLYLRKPDAEINWEVGSRA